MMPGVLQIESVAQACAINAYRDEDPPQDFAIVGVDGAKFRRVVLPGDTLEIHVETIKEKGKILVFAGKSFVNGQLANEMTLTAYVSERKGT
jgi:3-hydroxyacyl-[acyl-carrier-protein] dehydratase